MLRGRQGFTPSVPAAPEVQYTPFHVTWSYYFTFLTVQHPSTMDARRPESRVLISYSQLFKGGPLMGNDSKKDKDAANLNDGMKSKDAANLNDGKRSKDAANLGDGNKGKGNAGVKENSSEKQFRLKVAQVLVMISFYLELIIACFVIVLIIYGIVALFINFSRDAHRITNLTLFSSYIEKALTIVVGIEFLKMLCRHSLASVVEVIMFYLSRSLIVETTTMSEGLLCVLGVAGLFAIRKYLFIPKVDDPTIDVRNAPLVYIRKHAKGKRGNPDPAEDPRGSRNS
jgi:hypothetical protein